MIFDMIHAGNPLTPREMPREPKVRPISAPRQTGAGLGSMTPKANIDFSQVPTMHKGGPIKEDGIYRMKAGEHVLTASEAEIAKKHALMFSGLKSLAKAGQSNLKKGVVK